jgi:hypothetical protein
MSTHVRPTGVSLVVPLAEAPAEPALVAEGLPAEIADVGDGYATLRVSHDADGVSWVPTGDATRALVKIDAAESMLTVTVEVDGPEIPPVVNKVARAARDRFGCVPADETPAYVFERAVPVDGLSAALDRDCVTSIPTDGESSIVLYEYGGIGYQITDDGSVIVGADADDPANAMASLATHLEPRLPTNDRDDRFGIEATHVTFALAENPDTSRLATRFREILPTMEVTALEQDGFQMMLAVETGDEGNVRSFTDRATAETVEAQVRLRPERGTIAVSSPTAGWTVVTSILERVAKHAGVPVGDFHSLEYQVITPGDTLADVIARLPEPRVTNPRGDGRVVRYQYEGVTYTLQRGGLVTPDVDVDEARTAVERLLTHLNDSYAGP